MVQKANKKESKIDKIKTKAYHYSLVLRMAKRYSYHYCCLDLYDCRD
jgi:hypothetical protein